MEIEYLMEPNKERCEKQRRKERILAESGKPNPIRRRNSKFAMESSLHKDAYGGSIIKEEP